MRRLLKKAVGNDDVAGDIEDLGIGKAISKRIVEQFTFDNMYSTTDGLWTVMLHGGYITKK